MILPTGRRAVSARDTAPALLGMTLAATLFAACSSDDVSTRSPGSPAENSSGAPSEVTDASTPIAEASEGRPSLARAPDVTAAGPARRDDRRTPKASVTEAPVTRADAAAASAASQRGLSLSPETGSRAAFAAEPMILPPPSPFPADLTAPPVEDRERYARLDDNATIRTADEPVSTFSIDVDTGAYANVRRFLEGGQLPPADAVRIEELVNYFDYDYPVPTNTDAPFSVTTELGPSPWNAGTRLLRVGLKAYEPTPDVRPAANLVFLVDVSGSMDSPDKLGLLKTSLNLLAGELSAEDRVGIVVYAGASGVALEPVAGNDRAAIARALASLAAGGSTNGEAGIELAYRLADEHFVEGGVNRVILATDGDFNVGTADVEALVDLIERRRASGIALTTLGFGTGNYNDHLMERLADTGDGAYAYIDTLNEARKVLVEELAATLLTVARDVKIQLEFNPAVVAEHRLLGYTNRLLAAEDFSDDRVDAGEIGAGHSVTALYEIALHGDGGERQAARRYAAAVPTDTTGGEIAALRLRYKRPAEDRSRALETLVRRADAIDALAGTSDDFRFAAAVAAFGQHLRGDTRVAGLPLADVVALASAAKGQDRFGYRADFVRLAELGASLAAFADPLTRRRHDDGAG